MGRVAYVHVFVFSVQHSCAEMAWELCQCVMLCVRHLLCVSSYPLFIALPGVSWQVTNASTVSSDSSRLMLRYVCVAGLLILGLCFAQMCAQAPNHFDGGSCARVRPCCCL
jgi:hypothetical protein